MGSIHSRASGLVGRVFEWPASELHPSICPILSHVWIPNNTLYLKSSQHLLLENPTCSRSDVGLLYLFAFNCHVCIEKDFEATSGQAGKNADIN